MKIPVLQGGFSRERAISLRSGDRIFQALKTLGHDTWQVDPGTDEGWIGSLEPADLVFIALHGHFGEDGKVQNILQRASIPFTGSDAYVSAVAFNKVVTKQWLVQQGFSTPAYEVLKLDSDSPTLLSDQFPLIIKPIEEGSSLDTYIVDNPEGLVSLKESLKDQYPIMLLERFVQGQELSISFLGGEVLPILEIMPNHRFYDFPCKYTPGMAQLIAPAAIPDSDEKRIRALCLQIFKDLEISDFARLDGILSQDTFSVLEINTIPGMTQTSDLPASAMACGMDFGQVVDAIIQSALKRYTV